MAARFSKQSDQSRRQHREGGPRRDANSAAEPQVRAKYSHVVMGSMLGLFAFDGSPVAKLIFTAVAIIVLGAAMGLAKGLREGLSRWSERALDGQGRETRPEERPRKDSAFSGDSPPKMLPIRP